MNCPSVDPEIVARRKAALARLDFPRRLWVGGQWLEASGGEVWAVRDPATGERVGEVPWGGRLEAGRAIAAAAASLPHWRATSLRRRSEILARIQELLRELREPLAFLRTAEQGGPHVQSLAEVDFAADYFDWYSRQVRRLRRRRVVKEPDRSLRVELQPVGVVAAITPWNAPFSAPARKMSAALAAGCTVVLKPSELTPICALALAWICHRAGLPPGVLNVVFGDAEAIGETFLEEEAVRLITFTGSTRVGKWLMAGAARGVKRVFLELGGNAPFVVFADADLDAAARDATRLRCANSGQVCIAANRLLVERPVHAALVEKLAANFSRLRLGHGDSPDTDLGPLIRPEAAHNAERLARDAVRRGAKVVCGGRAACADLPERFYPATLVDGVRPEMEIARTELFAPLLPVIEFSGEEEALRLVNGTEYGLAAYLYTRDLGRARRLAGRIEAGVVGINHPRPLAAHAPFGGVKQSGFGREGGAEGVLEFLEPRLIGIREG